MSNDGINFNIQQFLSEMRGEMHDGFDRLDRTAAQVRADLTSHEINDIKVASDTATSLAELSRAHDNLKWLGRTVFAAIIVAVIGVLVAAWR